MALNVCMCGSVCLSQIKNNNLTQYLTNTLSSTNDTIITPRNLFLTHTHLALLLLFFSPIFLPVLHAPMCFDYWLCVFVCVVSVYLEMEQDGHFCREGGGSITDGPCQISVHLALFLSKFSRTHMKTRRFMFGILSRLQLHFDKNTYMCTWESLACCTHKLSHAFTLWRSECSEIHLDTHRCTVQQDTVDMDSCCVFWLPI